ncbi:MAG: hypothetical protein P8Y00_00695 [Deltaproteobacteria bacterium]
MHVTRTGLFYGDVVFQEPFVLGKVLAELCGRLLPGDACNVLAKIFVEIFNLEKVEDAFIKTCRIMIVGKVFLVTPQFQNIIQQIVEVFDGHEPCSEAHGVFIVKAGEQSDKDEAESEKDGDLSPNGFHYETPR